MENDVLIKQCLLDILGETEPGPPRPVPSLDKTQWSLLLGMSDAHRLSPLLHMRLQSYGDGIDPGVRSACAAAFRASAVQALATQGALIRVNQLLASADITYAALKGARLAWRSYSHPALRPMRDIDILVAPSDALRTYSTLASGGFVPAIGDPVSVDYAFRHNKHLPGLHDPQTATRVEVHTRLSAAVKDGAISARLSDTAYLLGTRGWLAVGEADIPFLGAAETLLHLIVHGAEEHRFDNGPLLLSDIVVLIRSDQIDWHRFWDMAREGGWERAAWLVLALTEKYHGSQPIRWFGSDKKQVPQHVLESAGLMMLQDFDMRGDLGVQVELSTRATNGGAVMPWKRLFPARHVLASFADRPAQTPLIWLYYPLWLASKTFRTIQGRRNPAQSAELVRALVVQQWLHDFRQLEGKESTPRIFPVSTSKNIA